MRGWFATSVASGTYRLRSSSSSRKLKWEARAVRGPLPANAPLPPPPLPPQTCFLAGQHRPSWSPRGPWPNCDPGAMPRERHGMCASPPPPRTSSLQGGGCGPPVVLLLSRITHHRCPAYACLCLPACSGALPSSCGATGRSGSARWSIWSGEWGGGGGSNGSRMSDGLPSYRIHSLSSLPDALSAGEKSSTTCGRAWTSSPLPAAPSPPSAVPSPSLLPASGAPQ